MIIPKPGFKFSIKWKNTYDILLRLPSSQKVRIISRHILNGYLETLNLAPTQCCDQPGFYQKTRFLRSHSLS